MSEQRKRTIEEMVDDNDLCTEAIRRGIHEELLSRARAGHSVPVGENGKVVWLSPDEICRSLGYTPPGGAKPSSFTWLDGGELTSV